MEIKQEFISHCGPDEWVVCNCLSERDDHQLFSGEENILASKEAEEVEDSLDDSPLVDDLSAPAASTDLA